MHWLKIALMSLAMLLIVGCSTTATGTHIAYRGPPYKAPTPWSAPGATTLHFATEVKELISEIDPLLVNVAPITLSPKGVDGKRIWILKTTKRYQQIPGSIWLPNVGYQSLSPTMDTYFSSNLARFTNHQKPHPILFYCAADCWMSWNAVIRARQAYGYQNIYWYPFGIDGWLEQDYALEPSIPIEIDK